jgi:hypothetical protein
MFLKEEYNKRTILLLRWALIIIVGYVLLFSFSLQTLPLSFIFGFSLYALSNLGLTFFPQTRFRQKEFVFYILLLDILMTTLALFFAAQTDSEFYVIYFLILLLASTSRRLKLIGSAFGLILVFYGASLYLKSPADFWSTGTLLRFPFLFIVTFFFYGMIESYNRLLLEKEILREDYLELEALTEVAQSIGQGKRFSDFLFQLTRIICEKFSIVRCSAIFVDSRDKSGLMVSSNDSPKMEPIVLDLARFPAIRKSLKAGKPFGNAEDRGAFGEKAQPNLLKAMPLSFDQKKLGTLYLWVNTIKHQLTHREEFFLDRLGQITSLALSRLGRDSWLFNDQEIKASIDNLGLIKPTLAPEMGLTPAKANPM